MSTAPIPTELVLAGAIVVFIFSRLMAQRALRYLDEEGKVKLVNAGSKHWYWWILYGLVLASLYYLPVVGLVILAILIFGGTAYNIYWVRSNDLPSRYVQVATVSNVVLAVSWVLFGIWLALLVGRDT